MALLPVGTQRHPEGELQGAGRGDRVVLVLWQCSLAQGGGQGQRQQQQRGRAQFLVQRGEVQEEDGQEESILREDSFQCGWAGGHHTQREDMVRGYQERQEAARGLDSRVLPAVPLR